MVISSQAYARHGLREKIGAAWRRGERRQRTARKLGRWLRMRRNWMNPLTRQPWPDADDWARRQMGRGSLSVQGCLCCHRLRRRYGPRFSERRRIAALEDA